MRSVIVDVRKAIISGLKARPGLTGVQVTYGWSGDDRAERERIFTNRPRATHDPTALKAGRNFRDEAMELDIVLQVEGVGLAPEETDDRAIILGQEVEEFIADSKNSLGVAGLNWIVMARMELNNLYNDRGSLTEVTYTARYNARLT
jgi:hypothetical protein